jgi:RNA polymerase sigma-70 factor (ECF subfamily)
VLRPGSGPGAVACGAVPPVSRGGKIGAIEALSEASDAELVRAIGQADDGALAEAYRRHADPMRALARRLSRDQGISDEVVQEVFVRLWDRADRFDPTRGSLRSYLLAQTHGRALDAIRSESARRRREARDARLEQPRGDDVEREVIGRSVSEQVRAAMAALPEDERVALELAYFGGHPYRVVAERLGEPEGTVKSRIRSGLSRLRVALRETRP